MNIHENLHNEDATNLNSLSIGQRDEKGITSSERACRLIFADSWNELASYAVSVIF